MFASAARAVYYSSGSYDTTVKTTWAADLPRDFGLSGNVNVPRLGDDASRFSQGAFSVSLAHSLGGPWAGYWEGYAVTPMTRDAGAGWTVNSGVTRAIGANLQVDLEIGRGVTHAADWFVGVGFVVRHHLTQSLRR